MTPFFIQSYVTIAEKYTPGLLLIIDFYAITRTLLGLGRIIMMTVVKSD